MPWKGEKDPYKIWLSEVILQQTRVEQGWDYYNKFVKAFPTIKDLASAPDLKVFKLWEGLGYYTRCKNLITTARHITDKYNGVFPTSYEEILKLKGVGPYTAAAIASFAYNLPYAVVDGNVFRIISRVFGMKVPIDSTEGKKQFTSMADELLDRKYPGIYNQAIMDFGATICKPVNPHCDLCPFNKKCIAIKEAKIDQLPVKSKTISKKERWFYYFVFQWNDKIYVRKRSGKDIWQNLHDFLLIEKEKPALIRNLLAEDSFKEMIGAQKIITGKPSAFFRQQLTHQMIRARFIPIQLQHSLSLPGELRPVSLKALQKLAFPKIIIEYLEQKR